MSEVSDKSYTILPYPARPTTQEASRNFDKPLPVAPFQEQGNPDKGSKGNKKLAFEMNFEPPADLTWKPLFHGHEEQLIRGPHIP